MPLCEGALPIPDQPLLLHRTFYQRVNLLFLSSIVCSIMIFQTKANCIVTDSRSEYDDVRGQQCSSLNVRANDDGDFPMVDVEYSWSMCNKNAFDIELRDPQAKFYDWTRVAGSKETNVANPRIPVGGRTLKSGECLEEKRPLSLDTENRYNVATQLEGFVLDSDGSRLSPTTGKSDALRF